MSEITTMFGAYITLNKFREFLSPGNTDDYYIKDKFFSGNNYDDPVMVRLKNNIHVYFRPQYADCPWIADDWYGEGEIFIGVPSEICYFEDDGIMRVAKFSMKELKQNLIDMFKLNESDCNITYVTLDCAEHGYITRNLSDYQEPFSSEE